MLGMGRQHLLGASWVLAPCAGSTDSQCSAGMVRIAAATPESARQDWWASGTQIALSLDKAAAVLPR